MQREQITAVKFFIVIRTYSTALKWRNIKSSTIRTYFELITENIFITIMYIGLKVKI